MFDNNETHQHNKFYLNNKLCILTQEETEIINFATIISIYISKNTVHATTLDHQHYKLGTYCSEEDAKRALGRIACAVRDNESLFQMPSRDIMSPKEEWGSHAEGFSFAAKDVVECN